MGVPAISGNGGYDIIIFIIDFVAGSELSVNA
jgi:hypothetical protein